MVGFDDVYTTEGVLLISRGTAVTDALILRIDNDARQRRVERVIRVHGRVDPPPHARRARDAPSARTMTSRSRSQLSRWSAGIGRAM